VTRDQTALRGVRIQLISDEQTATTATWSMVGARIVQYLAGAFSLPAVLHTSRSDTPLVLKGHTRLLEFPIRSCISGAGSW
jgi:hypothetical protein